ncbi:hypothetical protein GGI22_007090, partial [Coemansia erecta]
AVRREMALDVAAFLWAPLAGAGARAAAAAKDSVLSEWRRRRGHVRVPRSTTESSS